MKKIDDKKTTKVINSSKISGVSVLLDDETLIDSLVEYIFS